MIICYALIILLVVYVGIRILYDKFWNKRLEIDVYLPSENVHEGEITNVKEVIINDKLLPLPILEIFFHFEKGLKYTDMSNSIVSDKLYRRDVFAVGIKRKISRTFELYCEKRGYYTLEQLDMMSSDLFLQQKFLGKKEFFDSFYVYPRKVRGDKINLPYKRIMGEILAKKNLYEDPFSFAGIRDYVITDPMNTINWKATAKSQDLVVNVYDASIDQKVYVLLDTFENKSPLSEDLNEESIRIAAALVERLFMQGVEVTLQANGRDVVTKERISFNELKGLGIAIMKQSLAKLERGNEKPITELLDNIPKDTYVVLVSKNQELQKVVKDTFSDFLWIVPYRYESPEIDGLKGMYFPWEMEISNVNI